MAVIVFMGTPDFAVPALRRLVAEHEVIGVVTQPDRPAGRSRQIQCSPVKQVAIAANIPVFQPEKLRAPEAVAQLQNWTETHGVDVFVVAAFGQILPQTILDLPRLGSLNIHASLLPRWRGAAPIQAAIRAGDAETGITIMKMDAGLDTGPILSQRRTPIAADETAASLHDRLAQMGSDLLIETLPGYLAGTIVPQPQDDAQATIAPRIRKEEGHINWNMPAVEIERMVRAFTPWPGTFTIWDGRMLKILAGSVVAGSAEPGRAIAHQAGVAIGTGEGLFVPTRLQLEGRAPQPLEAFLRGYGGFVGAQLR
ncbi:MAG: methionyl-tRNA formyltransferase [Aggregatilineales bacterium]